MGTIRYSRDILSRLTVASKRSFFDAGEFIPHFQPIVNLKTGHLSGLEVLARWQHPDFGILGPDRFVPLAEKHGWINGMTSQVVAKAFEAASILPEAATLSVNVSPGQLSQEGFPKLIADAAEEGGFPLDRLVLEVTESGLIENLSRAHATAESLKALGCRISLDDFGTGYSSLLHLQSLPFDEIKVDQKFVGSMGERRDSRKIVAAVIGLGHSLGLRTVAEGIETEEQREMMLWLGCELGQGWLFGRPMPTAQLGDYLDACTRCRPERVVPRWLGQPGMHLDASHIQRTSQLQAIFDGIPAGLAFLDREMRYVNLNQRLADINGFLVEEHIGRHVSEMVPQISGEIHQYLKRALSGEAISEVEIGAGSSEQRIVCYQPMRDEGGEVIGVMVAVMKNPKIFRTPIRLDEFDGIPLLHAV